jgi:hypothetical protein
MCWAWDAVRQSRLPLVEGCGTRSREYRRLEESGQHSGIEEGGETVPVMFPAVEDDRCSAEGGKCGGKRVLGSVKKAKAT